VKDFRPFLTKLRARGEVDAISALLLPGQIGIFAKQARELGFTKPLFGIESFEDLNEIKVSGGALVGQWYINAAEPSAEFIKRFSGKYPGVSLYAVGQGYDIPGLIAKASAPVKDRTLLRAEINKFLHTVRDYHGAAGVFSADGKNAFTFAAVVREVQADGFKTISATK